MSSSQAGMPISVNPLTTEKGAKSTKDPSSYDPEKQARGGGSRKKVIIAACGGVALIAAVIIGVAVYFNVFKSFAAPLDIATNDLATQAQNDLAKLGEEIEKLTATQSDMTEQQRSELSDIMNRTKEIVEEQAKLKQSIEDKMAAADQADEGKAKAESDAKLVQSEADKLRAQISQAATDEDKQKISETLERMIKEKDELLKKQAELAEAAQKARHEAEQEAKRVQMLQKDLEADKERLEEMAKKDAANQLLIDTHRRHADIYANTVSENVKVMQLLNQSRPRVSFGRVIGIIVICVVVLALVVMVGLSVAAFLHPEGTRTGLVPLDQATRSIAELFVQWGWVEDPLTTFPIVDGSDNFYDFLEGGNAGTSVPADPQAGGHTETTPNTNESKKPLHLANSAQ